MSVAGSIEILLSAAVQKRWRIKPTVRASESPIHWLGQWRVDFGRRPDRTSVAFVTNTATLYTFLLPAKDTGKSDAFERLFRMRLGFSLVDAASLEAWKAAPIRYAVGNPRRVVSSMNNLRQLLNWRGGTTAEPQDDDEGWLNHTPFSTLPGVFPDLAFAQRLAEAQRAPA